MVLCGTLDGVVEVLEPFTECESYFLALAEHPGSGVLLRRDTFAGAEATEDGVEIRFPDGLVVAVEGQYVSVLRATACRAKTE